MVLKFIEILHRAKTGPICSSKDWDLRHIARGSKDTLKEHGLAGVYDPDTLVNQDDKLADSFFKAAFEFAIGTGFFCIDTQRIIKFTEDELRNALKVKVPKVVMGKDTDQYELLCRKPEDQTPPMTFLGCYGIPIDEDLWLAVHQSMARHKIIDGLSPGSLETAYDMVINAGTPSETLAGFLEGKLTKEAVKRAGRPGMPLHGVSTSPTQHGSLGGFGIQGGYEKTDLPCVLAVPELKTGYHQLHKVAHFLSVGAPMYSAHDSFYRGYAGPPEGAALVTTASVILQILVHQACVVGGITRDIRYTCTTSRETLWSNSICTQAQARNIPRPLEGDICNTAGPNTDMILYEVAAIALTLTTSGAAAIWGVQSAGGNLKNQCTDLENKFAGEVLKAAASLKRSDANDIVKQIIPNYIEKLKEPPKGLSFTECVNPKTFKPKAEWLERYHKISSELIDYGIPLEKWQSEL